MGTGKGLKRNMIICRLAILKSLDGPILLVNTQERQRPERRGKKSFRTKMIQI